MCSSVIREDKFKLKILKKGKIKNFLTMNIITFQEDVILMVMKQACLLQHFFEMDKGKLVQWQEDVVPQLNCMTLKHFCHKWTYQTEIENEVYWTRVCFLC